MLFVCTSIFIEFLNNISVPFLPILLKYIFNNMPVHEFKVEMTCTGCSGAVERVVKKLGDKVEDMSIDLEGKSVQIKSNLSGNELLEVLKKTGKETTYLGCKN